jgi:hypothetical protein
VKTENTQSLRIRIIVVHRSCQRLAENVSKLILDVTVSKLRRSQRLSRNQLQIMSPLPQQEVGAHENRQGFIVSSVTYLKNRMLRYYDAENASVSFVDILLSVLVVCT